MNLKKIKEEIKEEKIKTKETKETKVKELTRIYNTSLPKEKYIESQFRHLSELHSGQRKLLMSEIDFLTRYYDKYDRSKQKYLLYIGASPGNHINYLNILFPELHYILYDKVDTQVDLKSNVTFVNKYFDNQEAEKYKNMNIFVVCDIRNLDIANHSEIKDQDKIILQDMNFQKKWCEIIKPKSALLKFRVSWEVPSSTYFDGVIYFQIWSGNNSTELRLVPDLNKIKTYDNKNIEEVCFYYNLHTRRELIKNNKYSCIGDYHESAVEGEILEDYLKKFNKESDIINVCDLSISISIYLNKYLNIRIDPKFLKKVNVI
jgi:hypothetical protein